MSRPVDRSMTVSAPHFVAQVSLSTSSAAEDVTAEVPMLALILVRNRVPMIIGSVSGWLTLAGRVGGPQAGAVAARSGERLGARRAGAERRPAVVAQGRHPALVVLDVVPLVDPPGADRIETRVRVAARPAGVVKAGRGGWGGRPAPRGPEP